MQPSITPYGFLIVWMAGGLLMFGAAAAYRRVKARPFFKPRFADVRVDANWCSGVSSTGLMGAMGWASNCLWVVVTRSHVHVGAHFPFNLFLPGFLLGLELSIPIASITAVETLHSSWRGDAVRVSYTASDDARGITTAEQLTIQPSRAEDFARVVNDQLRTVKSANRPLAAAIT